MLKDKEKLEKLHEFNIYVSFEGEILLYIIIFTTCICVCVCMCSKNDGNFWY